MWNILQDKEFAGIYNLGTGMARTWNDLVNAAFAALKVKPDIEYIKMPESIKHQYQNFTKADMTKMRKKLKIEFHSLEDGIKDYVQNYLNKNEFL